VNFLSGFTSGSVKVAAVNCVGSSAFRSVTIYSKPSTPAAISGPTAGVCAGSANVSYSIAAVNLATGYNWTAPANATIVSGQGTTNVTVSFNGSFTSGSLKVSANNSCGSSNDRSLTIRSTPAAPGTISGANSVCANQAGVVYSIAPVNGATSYNWVVPTGAIITAGQNTTSITVTFGTSGGSVKVRSVNACGNSSYKTLTVAVSCREAMVVSDNNNEVLVSPNPSSTHFTLNFNTSYDGTSLLIIHDISGRVVQTIENISPATSFRFGDALLPGVYVADLISGDERRIFRLVKQ
jgi:hypothetical protein